MTTAERGYGGAHQTLRRTEGFRVARGEAFCAKCGGWIRPGSRWHLAHDPFDRDRYLGPMHERCNCDTRLERYLHSRRRGRRLPRASAEAWL